MSETWKLPLLISPFEFFCKTDKNIYVNMTSYFPLSLLTCIPVLGGLTYLKDN